MPYARELHGLSSTEQFQNVRKMAPLMRFLQALDSTGRRTEVNMRTFLAIVIGAGILSLGWNGPAHAVSIDLTSGGSGILNSAMFQTWEAGPVGTGDLDPFLRMQHDGTERGYNTDGRPSPFHASTDPALTRSLLLSEIPTKIINGVDYREFILDINEPTTVNGRFLSLDQLRIYLSPTGNSTTTNLNLLGTLVYTLDAGANNWIKLNGNLAPTGTGDMFAYIPNGLFAGPNPYVTLYSRFGDHFASQGGYEQWSVQTIVPEPTSFLLLGSGLAALGAWRKWGRGGRARENAAVGGRRKESAEVD